MELMGLAATAGPVAATATGSLSASGFLADEVHSKELLTNVFGAAFRTGCFCVLFFLQRHPFFENMGAPPAEIFIGWHLDHLF
jgi:hypothetical protein